MTAKRPPVRAARRRSTAVVLAVTIALSACGDDEPTFETLAQVPDAAVGDIVALRADGDRVDYISRRTGEIFTRPLDDPDAAPELVASVEVSTDGEQRGLLGQVVLDGRRFAAWTDPDSLDLVVGELTDAGQAGDASPGGVERIVWSGTSTESKAVGGHLEAYDGRILLGLGELTGWGRDHGSGGLVLLDPDAGDGQEPELLSDGWNNPWAFTVTPSGDVWVADNARDGSNLPVDERDGERIARGDGVAGSIVEPPPQRAPAAVVELPDGRLGVCGFLDGEMWAYEVSDDGDPERAGTIGPCQTGAAVSANGSIVTVAGEDDGPVLSVRPGRT